MKLNIEKKWYAIYTKSRTEKKVNQFLIEKGIEVYLPLQKRLKQWSDRKKWVEEPLFRSYIFVKILEKEYLNVLKSDGVVKFVNFSGKRIPIPPAQIETVKLLLANEINIEVSTKDFIVNEHVEVIAGVLMGLQGTLTEFRGKYKVLIKIETIGQVLLIDIPLSYLKKIDKRAVKTQT